jgi:predicted transcriptional regulator
MKNEVNYLMSQKQLNRFNVISMAIEGKVTIREAAERLGLSERQVIRLKKGVINEGPAFLIHKNIGRVNAGLFLTESPVEN